MKIALFDTETTDLMSNTVVALKHRPHIIEFYGMVLEKEGGEWRKTRELEFLCKPPVEINEEVQSITGISPEDVADKLPFRVHAQDVAEFFEGAEMVVAHNLSYDVAVVETEFERWALASGEKKTIVWPQVPLCTVEATEHLKGHRLNLSALHEHLFGEPFAGAHRAREDVEAMGRCFVELWDRGEI